MNYTAIRNEIVSELFQHLQVPVVPTDTTQPKPPYPFVSYKITTVYRSDAAVKTGRIVPAENPDFEHDYEYTLKEQPQMVISFSTYSEDDAEAVELAVAAQDWFKIHGQEYLKSKNLVSVNITPLQDRTVLIVDNFEKRIGFDVTLRTTHEQKTRIETIEILTIGGDKA